MSKLPTQSKTSTILPSDGGRKAKSATVSAETQSLEEVDEFKQAIRDSSNKERKNILEQTDSTYWFSTYFPTSELRDSFLLQLGALGLLEDDQHINGRKLAAILGITLDDAPKQRMFKPSPKLTAIARQKGE